MSKSIHDNRDSKPKGWFSRRHQTREAHEDAVARYQAFHGRDTRQEFAQARQEVRDQHTASQQIEALDARLGAGVGARKERARLGAAR